MVKISHPAGRYFFLTTVLILYACLFCFRPLLTEHAITLSRCMLRGFRLHRCPYWIRPSITVSNHNGVFLHSTETESHVISNIVLALFLCIVLHCVINISCRCSLFYKEASKNKGTYGKHFIFSSLANFFAY